MSDLGGRGGEEDVGQISSATGGAGRASSDRGKKQLEKKLGLIMGESRDAPKI